MKIKEIIPFPANSIDETRSKGYRHDRVHGSDAPLNPKVAQELGGYVSQIAQSYRCHAFHCFEHASHVAMSVVKLVSRIVGVSALSDQSYGIASDALAHFACVFSAVIHDVDHPGVSNAQLVKENVELGQVYHGLSIAEQNSFHITWSLLMDESFSNLREAICPNSSELIRFRQLVVNSIMATDVMDKNLTIVRNNRWNKAFGGVAPEDSDEDAANRKATIVVEHLIQASDVAHTMQHWHIYRKWNERFFEECYDNWIKGRSDTNPAENWYRGELGFFDFYIIPLAKKLKDCGVFGVSSDEYLNYAEKNRAEWEERGQEVVNEMLARVQETYKSQQEELFGSG